MQEQNFEKEVRQKMEELSLTPSDPVWVKIEQQVQKKRDRKRLLFWLPLGVLLLSAGVWFVATDMNSSNTIATAREESKNTRISDSEPGKESIRREKLVNENKGQDVNEDLEKTNVIAEKETLHEQGKVSSAPTKELTVQAVTEAKEKSVQKTKNSKLTTQNIFRKTSLPANKNGVNKTQQPAFRNNAAITNSSEKNNLIKGNEPVSSQVSGNETLPQQNTYTESEQKQDKSNKEDTISVTKPEEKLNEKDSIAIQKDVVTNRKSISAKWQFAIEAGIGSSGVNNGMGLFGGGTKSLASNAFARDMSFSASPSNSPQTGTYNPPSEQEKSRSFLVGVLVKRQLGKRSFFSTGLQYNFYSTKMQVGQNVQRDTVVDPNKSVTNFYTNSGNSFSDYQNKFHFISLPVAFDIQLLNKLPLDFHMGLSVQQLVQTNALLYSSLSQVYYNDEDAFNKTYLFSHFGLGYSFLLSKKLSLKAGPRVSYSHSKVMKASDRHLFSYGLATQLVFSGK